MIALIWFVLAVLASPFESKSRLEAENAVLRHQLIVLGRKVRGRAQLTNNDRWFLVQMYRWFPSILTVVTIVQPETLVRWHRAGFRRYWRWKSNPRGGRPRIEIACADPADEHGEPALGCAAHPRRTAQAWVFRRSINRRQLHGQATWTSKSGMADLAAKPRSRHCRHGSVTHPASRPRSQLLVNHNGLFWQGNRVKRTVTNG